MPDYLQYFSIQCLTNFLDFPQLVFMATEILLLCIDKLSEKLTSEL